MHPEPLALSLQPDDLRDLPLTATEIAQPDAAFSALIEQVYEAALDASLWPEVLASAAGWLSASRGLLFTPWLGLGDDGFFYSHGITAEEMTIWSSRHVGKDFWTERVAALGLGSEGSVVLAQDLSTREELLASDYYRHHLVRMGIAWFLGSVVLVPSERNGQLPAVGFSVYRGADEPGFDELSRRKMQLLVPHLSRALGVMFRLRDAEITAGSAAAALDALRFGVVQLDGVGQVVHCNAAARRILASGDGLGAERLFLRARDPAAQALLRQALDATANADGGTQVSHFSEVLRVPRTANGEAYLLQLSRLPVASRFGTLHAASRMVVFITDERRPALADGDVLQRLYGLSPAEARCALALGEGQLAQAAERLKLSIETVKTQLKQIYAKTGCQSRADLTRLMLSLAHV